jgi:DinB superfamily
VYVVEGDREFCPVCRFEWAAVPPGVVTGRVTKATDSIISALSGSGDIASRPAPERWSALEYGAHVRDVLLLIRDRLVNTVVEETPTPPKLHRDERVDLGLYSTETQQSVCESLAVSADLFRRFFDTVAPDNAERTVVYSKDFGGVRTLAWTGAQAVHESEHHLSDIEENVRLLR